MQFGRLHQRTASMQIPYVSVPSQGLKKWKKVADLDPAFGCITCLQPAPWCTSHPLGTCCNAAGPCRHRFTYAPLREHLRHILFAACSRRLLALDIRSPADPILSTYTPRSVGHAAFLHVDLRERLVPFPEASKPCAVAATDTAGAGASSQQQSGVPRAVVAVGHMTASCRTTGVMFTMPISLMPPLRGVLLRDNPDGRSKRRRRDVDSEDSSPAGEEDLEALLGESAAKKPELPFRLDPVLLPTLHAGDGESAVPLDGRRGPCAVPWSFSLAAAAVCLGTPQVFGFPLRAHMHADAQALADTAAAIVSGLAACNTALGDGAGAASGAGAARHSPAVCGGTSRAGMAADGARGAGSDARDEGRVVPFASSVKKATATGNGAKPVRVGSQAKKAVVGKAARTGNTVNRSVRAKSKRAGAVGKKAAPAKAPRAGGRGKKPARAKAVPASMAKTSTKAASANIRNAGSTDADVLSSWWDTVSTSSSPESGSTVKESQSSRGAASEDTGSSDGASADQGKHCEFGGSGSDKQRTKAPRAIHKQPEDSRQLGFGKQPAYAPLDVITMLRDGIDGLGAVFQWDEHTRTAEGSGHERQAADTVCAAAVPEDDLVAGARLLEKAWAAGDDVRCFHALVSTMPRLQVIRALVSGSPVVQTFVWGQSEPAAWPPSPERLELRFQSPDVTVDSSEMRRLVAPAGMPRRVNWAAPGRVEPVPTLLSMVGKLYSWNAECTTCTDQLEGWWGLWSDAPLSMAAACQWRCPDTRRVASTDAGDAPGVPRSSQGEEATVHCWPFEGVKVTGSVAAAPAVVTAAVAGLLPRVKSALSLADLWAAVLILHGRVAGGKELEEQERLIAARPRQSRGWRVQVKKESRRPDEDGRLEHFCGRPCPREKGELPVYCLEDNPVEECKAREGVAALLAGDGADEYLLFGGVPGPLPGRVIASASKVYASHSRCQAVARMPEKPDTLLQVGLRHAAGASADSAPGGIGADTAFAWIVQELRGMGKTCPLQLHCIMHPWWRHHASLAGGAYISYSRVLKKYAQQADVGTSGSGPHSPDDHDEVSTRQGLGCDLAHWVLLPVETSRQRRVTPKSRHKLCMGPEAVPDVDREIGERLEDLLSTW